MPTVNPNADLLLRLAQPPDLDTVARIRHASMLALGPDQMTHHEATAWAHRPDQPERCRKAIEAQRLSLALQEGDAVGWVAVVDDLVEGLYVVPGRWRCGIGSWLMDKAEEMIRASGYSAARLNTGGATLSWYQRRGYEAVGAWDAGRGTPMRKLLS